MEGQEPLDVISAPFCVVRCSQYAVLDYTELVPVKVMLR